ncbi:MAG: inorganic pyrophosphatase [Acidobacteria bacterium]|nr:MAG: inorganic pyrophosphatase [Acidobacteriota bacterium]PYX40879.1 MAG: inorganic pyrophosphatase [Acidobacteriota bacterium]
MKRKTGTSKTNHDYETSSSIDVIIETPRGSRNKIKYDPSSRRFRLSKVMPEGMMFPYDFGFVPATKAEDGDPLDVLVLTDEALFPGCLVDVKLVGVIEAEQTEKGETKRNDRLVAIATQSLLYSEIRTLEELNPKVLEQIDAFFVNYQRVRDIEVKILGHGGPQQAHRILDKAGDHKKAA